jgi:hypothetical protein
MCEWIYLAENGKNSQVFLNTNTEFASLDCGFHGCVRCLDNDLNESNC